MNNGSHSLPQSLKILTGFQLLLLTYIARFKTILESCGYHIHGIDVDLTL